MKTTVSSKGQVVLPVPLRRLLGIQSGDQLEISVKDDRIVLSPQKQPARSPRIIEDPLTGFHVIDVGPDAPVLTSEMVRDILADFP